MTIPDLFPLERKLAAAWPADDWQGLTVLVAVSGGPDSVALLRALAALKGHAGGTGRLIVAHFDHHLRQESAADAEFVAALAGKLNLPFEIGQATAEQLAPPTAFSDGVEAAVREFRYAFLQSAAEKVGARYVATGHTADDQIETVLFNLLRGTGLSGLAGMPRARALGSASLIRPMLNVRRAEVIEYLNQIKQNYRTDATNESLDFTRNRIRHEVLPMLRENVHVDVDQSLGRLAQLAGDAQRLIEQLADDLLERCLAGNQQRGEIRLNLLPLADVDRHLAREMFVALWRRMDWPSQDMGFAQWDTLAAMAASPKQLPAGSGVEQAAAKRTFPGNILVRREGDVLLLAPQDR